MIFCQYVVKWDYQILEENRMATYTLGGRLIKDKVGISKMEEFFKRVDMLEEVRLKEELPEKLWYTEQDYDNSNFNFNYAERQESLRWHGNLLLRHYEKSFNGENKLTEGEIFIRKIADNKDQTVKIIYAVESNMVNAIPQKIEGVD